MYTEISSEFESAVNSCSRRFAARMKQGGEILDAEIKTYTVSKYSSAGEDYTIGNAFASSVDISCVTNVYLKNQEVTLETGLYLPSGECEYIPDGVYTVISTAKKGQLTRLKGYDRMYTAGSSAFRVPADLPVTLSAAAEAVATQMGCTFDADCLADAQDILIDSIPEAALSVIAGYLAGLVGRNAYIDRAGRLTFKAYTDSGYAFDGDRIADCDTDESARTINWLECTAGENTLQSGTGTGYTKLENPIMTQEILDGITAKIAGFSYYGAEVPFLLGDPRLDPWDIIHYKVKTAKNYFTDENGLVLVDEYGNVFTDWGDGLIPILCHEITYNFDGGLSMDIASYALSETEENTNFRGPMQQKVEHAQKAAEEAKKEVQALDLKLSPEEIFNRLTDNGTLQGVYKDEETGDIYINASYIVSGILSSADKSTWVNMDDGTFSFAGGGIVYDPETGLKVAGDLIAEGKVTIRQAEWEEAVIQYAHENGYQYVVDKEYDNGAVGTTLEAYNDYYYLAISVSGLQVEFLVADIVNAQFIHGNKVAGSKGIFDNLFAGTAAVGSMQCNTLQVDTAWQAFDPTQLGTGFANGSFEREQLSYKRIGHHVYISGSIVLDGAFSGDNTLIATLPEDCIPKRAAYRLAACSGARIARIFVNKSGQLKLEWIIKLADGTKDTVTEGVWISVSMDYWVD